MKSLTVIKSDSAVYVDGVALPVDCSHLPESVHAIQWYGDREPPYGEIEFAPDKQGRKMPNLRFSDVTPFQHLADNWKVEKVKRDKAETERVAALAKASAEAPKNKM